MSHQTTALDFNGQSFFIGIDVHKRSFHVTIRSNQMVLKRFSMDPSPEQLIGYMHKKYPGGVYHSVYEAGYSGFWIHRHLVEGGISNVVIHPADVPTTHKEKMSKTDRIDSGKLARELEHGSLEAIYIPDDADQQLRSLVRLRARIICAQTRVKNRIKSHLAYYGIDLPDGPSAWSGAFIGWLETLAFSQEPGRDYLDLCLDELRDHKKRLAQLTRLLRTYSRKADIAPMISYLKSVPGIGFISAITLYAELIDMDRFADLDHLAAFVGLIPAMDSSGEHESSPGINPRHSPALRALLIESAWIAVRKDPALTLAFSKLTRRMSKQKAIIRIAKKLLNRIRYVWKHQTMYVSAVVE